MAFDAETSNSSRHPSPANPRAVSNWPDDAPASRSAAGATVAIRKHDCGKIGPDATVTLATAPQ